AFERRAAPAAIHPQLNVLGRGGDVIGERGQNVLAQNRDQVGLAARGPFVREEDLEPFLRDWSGAAPAEQVEAVHAALRPNSLSSKPLRSLGMVIGTSSPLSRRAASG